MQSMELEEPEGPAGFGLSSERIVSSARELEGRGVWLTQKQELSPRHCGVRSRWESEASVPPGLAKPGARSRWEGWESEKLYEGPEEGKQAYTRDSRGSCGGGTQPSSFNTWSAPYGRC